jgi:hypothetical protein
VKLHLSKTDCVRAFQLANSVGNSDGDSHEMDLEEFCQCVLFLAKLAGFLGEGDKVPLASQCSVPIAECVSKLLTFLGCVVPEVGNRSSRNLARMKRQGSKGKLDALGPSFSSVQLPLQLAHAEESTKISVLGSGISVDVGVVSGVESIDVPPSPTAVASARLLTNNNDNSPKEVHADQTVDYDGNSSVLSKTSDDPVDHSSAEPSNSLNGSLEKVAITRLQSSFREMNLLPEHKWFHYACCLAQAGVNDLRDLLHLGSGDDVLIKFLAETCGMNVIQGKKVAAFLKAI